MWFKAVGRVVLALVLMGAGIGHFINTAEFAAQVPPWMPNPEAVIYVSGVVEIALAIALIALPRQRILVGWLTAALCIIIFPGNISQFMTQTDAFGLESDVARFIRLLFQPVLVVLALWSTGAWQHFRRSRAATVNSTE